jgi:hypothetical protein
MPPLSPEQRYPPLWELLQFGGAFAAKIHPVRRAALLSPFYGGERLFLPRLFEPRPVRTFTLIAAGAPVRRSDPAETRYSASSANSLSAQYLSGIPLHPKNPLAWTWSAAEANQRTRPTRRSASLKPT